MSIEEQLGWWIVALQMTILIIGIVIGLRRDKMLQVIYRQSAWEVLKDFMWWYFIIKCNEFHWKLDVDMQKIYRASNLQEARRKESSRLVVARCRAHRLDILYRNTITRSN